MYHPGSAWEYGLSIDVLGLIIEAESGQTLGAFLQERIWKPLGMVDTSFVVPPEKVKRYAKALPLDPDTGKPIVIADRTKPGKFECGGGCAEKSWASTGAFAAGIGRREIIPYRTRITSVPLIGASISVAIYTVGELGKLDPCGWRSTSGMSKSHCRRCLLMKSEQSSGSYRPGRRGR